MWRCGMKYAYLETTQASSREDQTFILPTAELRGVDLELRLSWYVALRRPAFRMTSTSRISNTTFAFQVNKDRIQKHPTRPPRLRESYFRQAQCEAHFQKHPTRSSRFKTRQESRLQQMRFTSSRSSHLHQQEPCLLFPRQEYVFAFIFSSTVHWQKQLTILPVQQYTDKKIRAQISSKLSI